MKQFIYIITLCCCLSAYTGNPNNPKPVLPEGDFQVEATVSKGNKLTVAWSSPKGLEGGAALNYTVYLGDKELGKTNENAISADISGNRFVNGRVITTDATGRTRMKVFLIKGDDRDLVYIPDPVFESYLTANHLDRDGQTNRQMSLEDAMLVKNINYEVDRENKPYIDNLIGVEAFSKLETLICIIYGWEDGFFKEKETLVDVSLNPKLRVLYLSSINFSTLDVSRNSKLEELYCEGNGLTNIDLKNLNNLKVLKCSSNKLVSIDISNNTDLEYLDCWGNQLTSLDISKNIKLEYLSCYYNQLTSLDISKNIKLVGLDCQINQLTNLDISKNLNLDSLRCEDNQLTSLDISKNLNLEDLRCENNRLTDLDLSKNTALFLLDCIDNPNLKTICVANVGKAKANTRWKKNCNHRICKMQLIANLPFCKSQVAGFWLDFYKNIEACQTYFSYGV